MITELRTLSGYRQHGILQMYWCRVSSRPSVTTALIPWWWIWDIPLRTLVTEGSAYVSMIVADVLVPSKSQATTNHDTCDVMWITQFVLCYVHKNIFYGVGLSVTHQFLYITDGLAFSRWHLAMRPEYRNTWTPQPSGELIPRSRFQVSGPFSEMAWTLYIPSATSEKAMML